MRPKRPTVRIDADLIRTLVLKVRIPGLRVGFRLHSRTKRSQSSIGKKSADLGSDMNLLEDQDHV